MALKVKAQERFIKLGKYPEGRWMYVMSPEIYGRLNEAKVLREASMRSGISQGAIQAAWTACGEVIRAWATEGHSVAVPGLGTMRFSLRSNAVEKVSDIGTGLIISRKVLFTPSVQIKKELSETSVSITCYNRKGEEVKHVTSRDEGKVEEPENPEEKPANVEGGDAGKASGAAAQAGDGKNTGGVAPQTGGDGKNTGSSAAQGGDGKNTGSSAAQGGDPGKAGGDAGKDAKPGEVKPGGEGHQPEPLNPEA